MRQTNKIALAAAAIAATLIAIGCTQSPTREGGAWAYAVDAAWPKPCRTTGPWVRSPESQSMRATTCG